MKTKYILKRIEDKMMSLKEEKEKIQKIEESEIYNKEKWLEKKRKGFYKVCEILEVDESQKGPLTYAFSDMVKEIFDFVIKYFELYEKFLENLSVYYKVENEFVQALTLVWFQHGCITGDFTKIVSNPELFEMFTKIVPNNRLKLKSSRTTFN